jgi:hypothetical protein
LSSRWMARRANVYMKGKHGKERKLVHKCVISRCLRSKVKGYRASKATG